MDRGEIHTCQRCGELEAQIAWLKSELGESSDANVLAELRQRHGLTKTEARMLELLAEAKGRIVPYARLADVLGLCANVEGNVSETLKVYAYHLRKKVGQDAVFTSWGLGLAAGPSGIEAYDAAKAKVMA